ncbi:MAG: hypothetical protein ABSB88_12775 [Bryobacteraceae bacterium]|jgi:hypothetical protein
MQGELQRENMGMPTTQQLGFTTFDGKLIDGLHFCRKVYDLFDQVRVGPDGIAKLRLRPTKVEKRLLEELIPIARYVQARYREGRRIKVRWFSGSQPYDAILWSFGPPVAHRAAPRKLFIEVTTAVHQNEYLARRLLHERGGSFGVKGIFRDKKTGDIVSKPYVHEGRELVTDLASQILERIKTKAGKNYSPATVLIVNCVPNTLMLDSEWNDAVERVTKAEVHSAFREVFLLETLGSHSTTLFRNRKRGRPRRNPK